ncbi:MAG: glycosyltransferase [Clostridia bacterium]|nr:glycosyltransferase [Clostridia bacterium]
MAKLSIIIPVYNVEDYLDECVESITSQIGDGRDDIEVVLVDDGSKDSSGIKCDSWSNKKKYINTIHKVNGGLSSARNAGLDVAIGEYILFVDSDDKIASGSIDSILKGITESNADMYFLSGIKFYPDGRREALDAPFDRNFVYQKDSIEVVKYISGMTRYPGSACTKAYNRHFLYKNELRFPSDRRIAEDLGFTLKCLLTANTFDVVEGDYYEYRQNREGSITSNSTSINKSFWNLAIFLHESVEMLSHNRQPIALKDGYALSLVAYEYSVMLVHYSRVTERVEEAKEIMNNHKWLRHYFTTKRGRVISLMISMLGVKATSKVLAYAYMQRERENS